MAYLIGTDEAGYGPNLGPLTVTGTLWRVPAVDSDLYRLLDKALASERPKRGQGTRSGRSAKLHVADSKAVYQSSGSIQSLERSVLAILSALLGDVPADEGDLLRLTFSKCIEDRVALFAGEPALWRCGEPIGLPLKCPTAEIQSGAAVLAECLASSGVGLLDVLCRPLFPAAFNRAVQQLGNKANVLSAQTMAVVQKLLKQLPPVSNLDASSGEVLIGCDKHGGRSRYLPLIQQFLTDQPVEILAEGREVSRYRWQSAGRAITIEFTAKGESFLPVAVASMVSKYVREVFMYVWNDFWDEHVDGLRPTKGYPADAKRFMADIEAAFHRLGIARDSVWRIK